MYKRIKLIANPISGGDSRPRVAEAVRFLEQAGARVELFFTAKRGDATLEAAGLEAPDYDLVIAAGGDGTLNEVANGLAAKQIPLAFLPLGTANVMALEMGLPATLEGACRVALYGEARSVHLAEISGRFFLMMAGVGYDAAAVRAVNSRLKMRTGKFAYLVAGMRAFLGYRPVALKVQTAEGEIYRAWHLIVTNIRRYGGPFLLAPESGLERPLLTACLVEQPGRLAILLFCLRILCGGRIFGRVRSVESSSFVIDGGVAPVQVDGDDFGDTPLKLSSRPGLLEMIFPR